jgi:hypothetical protein
MSSCLDVAAVVAVARGKPQAQLPLAAAVAAVAQGQLAHSQQSSSDHRRQ